MGKKTMLTGSNTPNVAKRITRKEVARLAGVSTTTITHVLQGNPKTGVNAATRERILRIVKETGYTPNVIASCLDQRSLKHIALILNEFETEDDGMMMALQAACRKEIQEAGYYFMTHNVEQRSAAGGQQVMQLFQSGRADGLLIYKPDFLNEDVKLLAKNNIPLVLLESIQPLDFPEAVSVTTDHYLGGCLAASYLVSKGHRKVAVLTPKLESLQTDFQPWRVGAFVNGIKDTLLSKNNGIEQLSIKEGDMHDPLATVKSLTDLEIDSPTALLVGDDLLALTAMTYFQQRGFRIPQDISIMGYGGNPYSRFTCPSLTTVQVPTQEVGRLAVKLLLDIMGQRPIASNKHLLKPSLIERGSFTDCRL